jgi:hypothetical protein
MVTAEIIKGCRSWGLWSRDEELFLGGTHLNLWSLRMLKSRSPVRCNSLCAIWLTGLVRRSSGNVDFEFRLSVISSSVSNHRKERRLTSIEVFAIFIEWRARCSQMASSTGWGASGQSGLWNRAEALHHASQYGPSIYAIGVNQPSFGP